MSKLSKFARYEFFYKVLNKHKPKTILEIGIWKGQNAIKMIEICHQYHKIITYYGFDLFEDLAPSDLHACEQQQIEFQQERTFESIRTNLNAIPKTRIYLFRGNTKETLPHFVATNNNPIDFIFIDGGHSFEMVEHDWKCCKRLMHDNTLVIFDDYVFNPEKPGFGCQKTIEELKKDKRFIVDVFNQIDHIDSNHFGKFDTCMAQVKRNPKWRI